MATVLIQDEFGDADATVITSRASAVGGTPQEHSSFTSGGASVVSGAAYPTGTGATVIGWDHDIDDAVMEAVLDKKSSIPAQQYFALGLRGSLSSVLWYSMGTGKVGGATDYDSFAYSTGDNGGAGGYLLAANGTGFATGENRIKITTEGNYIRGWINRREVVRLTRTSYASGRPLIQWGAPGTTTTGFHLKSITAWDADTRNQVQFVGDSMFRGDITVAGPTITNIGLTNRVPYIAATSLIDSGYDIDWSNLGVSGRQLTVMLTASQATSGTTNAFPQSTTDNTSSFGHSAFACRRTGASKDIIVIMGGINDLSASAGNVSAATCITRLEDIRDAVTGAGFSVVVCTVPNCDESKGIVGSGFNDKADEVNAWILANAGTFDAVADFTAETLVHDDFTATYRNEFDGVHWTTTSAPLAAAIVASAVESVLQDTGNPFNSIIGSGFGGYLIGV